ncbi:porin family protein [Tannerella forsythia]|uniref:PorT family protein n=1 Tax=Tannerella forsythia TaxID=28112 RepID=A0A3P1Z9P8_TANFO|nr:porin family protein [Tannerella forsythia]RRD79617.1 PorT family protein [Tannerella forsythia]
MKRILILFVLLTAGWPATYAQMTVGGKAGLNVSTITDVSLTFMDKPMEKIDIDYEYRLGMHVGGYAHYRFSSTFGLQTELLYSQMGYKETIPVTDYGGKAYANATAKGLLHYLTLPVLLRFTVPRTGLFLEAGPQAGFLLGNKLSFSADISEEINGNISKKGGIDAQTFDISAVAGIGYRMNNGLSVSARYIHGFKTSDRRFIPAISQNRAFQFSIAYDIKTF